MSQHEHDAEGNCIVPQPQLPTWRWSNWDLIAVIATTTGGVFSVLGQGCQLLYRECVAAANFQRQEFEFAEAQEAYEAQQERMAEELRSLVEGPTEMVFDETGGEDED